MVAIVRHREVLFIGYVYQGCQVRKSLCKKKLCCVTVCCSREPVACGLWHVILHL